MIARLDQRARAILIASCLVLSPKNFVTGGGGSRQGIANPLILLAGAVQVLWAEWSVAPGRSSERPLAAAA